MPALSWDIQDSVWPPRAAVVVSGMTNGDNLIIFRYKDNVYTRIRGGTFTINGTGAVVYDNEIPFGVEFNYLVQTGNGSQYFGAGKTVTLPGGNVALTDAITGLSAEVKVLAWASNEYEADNTIYRVSGRNHVVSGPGGLAGMFSAEVRFRTDTRTARNKMLELLNNCTMGTFQLRRSVANDGEYEGYYTVSGRTSMERVSDNFDDSRRDFVMTLVEKAQWPGSFLAKGYTYADLAAFYTGDDYADLQGDYATYLDLMRADLS